MVKTFKWSLKYNYETGSHVNLRAMVLKWPSMPLGFFFEEMILSKHLL